MKIYVNVGAWIHCWLCKDNLTPPFQQRICPPESSCSVKCLKYGINFALRSGLFANNGTHPEHTWPCCQLYYPWQMKAVEFLYSYLESWLLN